MEEYKDTECRPVISIGIIQEGFVSHTAHLQIKTWKGKKGTTMVIMVTMGGDLQPGRLADRLLTGLGQLQINPLQW